MQTVAGIAGEPGKSRDLPQRDIVRCAAARSSLDRCQAGARCVALRGVACCHGVRHGRNVIEDRCFKLAQPGRMNSCAVQHIGVIDERFHRHRIDPDRTAFFRQIEVNAGIAGMPRGRLKNAEPCFDAVVRGQTGAESRRQQEIAFT